MYEQRMALKEKGQVDDEEEDEDDLSLSASSFFSEKNEKRPRNGVAL